MTERRKRKMMSVLKHRQPDLTIVLENIHDPHNVSAILRTADAVGILEVQLLYSNEQFPKLGKKSSASAIKWIDRRTYTSVQDCFNRLRQEGFSIYATHLNKKSKSLYELDLTKKVALVFGNEHRGVSDEAVKLADKNFNIPMVGMIQSLNVSVACAVSLYEAYRQRQKEGMYKGPSLKPKELKKAFEQWKKK
ncbi:MAG TPA: TrmH family RNA methyltransferase [Bacteroidota bacterium]|nr:TrmH family RNA methyltransferase [Bacteroidota bacterium]